MDTKQGFFTDNAFAVYLNLSVGLHVPSLDSVRLPIRSRIGFIIYKQITDMFVWITFITLTVRLLTPDVPVDERSSGVLTTITTYQSAAKIIYLVVKRKEFQEFFEIWNNSFVDLPFKEEQQKIMKSELRKVKIIAVVLLVTLIGPAVPWCLMPFVPFVQRIHGGRFLAVPASFPFDALVSPKFEMVVMFQVFSAISSIAKSVVFDTFFISIAALLIVNFKHLHICMENMFNDEQVAPSVNEQEGTGFYVEDKFSGDKALMEAEVMKGSRESSSNDEEYMPHIPELPVMTAFQVSGDWTKMSGTSQQRLNSVEQSEKLLFKLKQWSKHHQDVNLLGQKLHALYSPILLMQFLTLTVILCFSAFIAVEVSMNPMHYVLAIAYGAGNIGQLFILCHYGDRLADASVSLHDAGLANGWEACRDKKVVSNLKIIFNRVQKPLQILAVNVFPLSAETCFAILKAAISYLMVLLEVNE